MKKIVRVIWLDPHSVDEWVSQDSGELDMPHKVETVGRLIKDESDFIVVSLNVGLEVNEDVSCSIIIPKPCIESMEVFPLVAKVQA